MNLIKKDLDILKYDIIICSDFYIKEIVIHNKTYNYIPPKSLINNLKLWKQNASRNNERYFQSILDMIQSCSSDSSFFSYDNFLYKKTMKVNSKFGEGDGFFKTFSIPIFNFLSNLIKKIEQNFKNNLNNNDYLKTSFEVKNKEIEINTKLNEINYI